MLHHTSNKHVHIHTTCTHVHIAAQTDALPYSLILLCSASDTCSTTSSCKGKMKSERTQVVWKLHKSTHTLYFEVWATLTGAGSLIMFNVEHAKQRAVEEFQVAEVGSNSVAHLPHLNWNRLPPCSIPSNAHSNYTSLTSANAQQSLRTGAMWYTSSALESCLCVTQMY